MVRKNACIYASTASLICFLVYVRALSCGFVNLDDPDYVLNNIAIRHLDGDFIIWAFTNPHAGFWMPLTWISLALDYKLWGYNPFGYHLTNNMLHAVNTGLVVLVADRVMQIEGQGLRVKRQGRYLYPATLLLAGLLWGLHPLRVESVAWVTERKDVLNGVFFLGSILCYLQYAKNQPLTGNKPALSTYYVLSLFFFTLSLMAKSVSVVLPVMLLVADWYPLNRFHKSRILPVLAEKLPFLLCSGAMAAATLYYAQQSRILASNDTLTIIHRLVISGNAIFEYCRLMIWPAGILPLHIIDISKLPAYLLKTAIIAVGCIGIAYFRKSRWLVATSLCFFIPLLPVLAFFQNGIQAFASRFTYIPSIVPSIAAASLVTYMYVNATGDLQRYLRAMIIILTSLIIFCSAIWTWNLIGIWRSTETVWSRIINVQPTGRAYKERGLYYFTTEKYREAEDDLTRSILFAKIAGFPGVYNLYAFRGVVLNKLEQHTKAVDDFSRAISLCPRPDFYFLRGRAQEALGKIEDSSADLRLAGPSDGTIDWEKGTCE
jgi:tetratricopeptide (TPR) repeat protein